MQGPVRCTGLKEKKQRFVVSHTPSTIGSNEDLYVSVPNIGQNNVIFPGSLTILFDLELTDTNTARSIVANIGRALVKNLRVNLGSNEILNISDYNIFQTYKDLWLPKFERENNLTLQGLEGGDGNIRDLQVKATGVSGTDEEMAIAAAYGNTFGIPIGQMFELIQNIPFYQHALYDRLQFVIHFAPYASVIKDAGTGTGASAKPADSAYRITNIRLQYDKIAHEGLGESMMDRYSRLAMPYERVLRSKVVTLQKADTSWNLQLDTPSKSLKGVLLSFLDPSVTKPYGGGNEKYYNPQIQKIEVTVEGEPSQLYSHSLTPKDHLEGIVNLFGSHDSTVTLGQYLTERYALFIDFRASPDGTLHGSGRSLVQLSDGISLVVNKKATASTGSIRCYV